MNFEFLRNLRGLGYIYENCTNAEKLVSSMPVQSVFTSRKSAELLAKFIYMAAHNQEMEDLSFADILADPTVRGFVHNRDIMDAFHYIRKSLSSSRSTISTEIIISIIRRSVVINILKTPSLRMNLKMLSLRQKVSLPRNMCWILQTMVQMN